MDNKTEEVAKILAEPVINSFDDNTLKIRRNLLVFCIIVFFFKFTGLSIDNVQLFFINTNVIEDHMIYVGVFLLIFYHWIHFIWNIRDHYIYLRLRKTGIKSIKRSNGSEMISTDMLDEATTPEQSTLYSWWLTTRNSLPRLKNELEVIIKNLRLTIDKNKLDTPAMEDLSSQIEKSTAKLHEVQQELERTSKTILSDGHIEASLANFDKTFFHYQKSQLIRFYSIEIGLPIVLGFIALSWIFKDEILPIIS